MGIRVRLRYLGTKGTYLRTLKEIKNFVCFLLFCPFFGLWTAFGEKQIREFSYEILAKQDCETEYMVKIVGIHIEKNFFM